MEAVIPGVHYQVKNFNKETHQDIVFVSKDKDGFNEGTTNEEIVNMMIDRFYALQSKSYSTENQVVIENFKSVRRMLAKRLTKKVEKLQRNDQNASY